MDIFERIFGDKKDYIQKEIHPDTLDFIFDGFNNNNLSIMDFEQTFLNPALETFKVQDSMNEYVQKNPQEFRTYYYSWLSIAYITYHSRSTDFLREFFKNLLPNNKINYSTKESLTRGNSNHHLSQNHPEIALKLDIATKIFQIYHAIYAKTDQNISSISHIVYHLQNAKFNPNATYFDVIFDYVSKQNFEEKVYVLFMMHVHLKADYQYVFDEEGNLAKNEQGNHIFNVVFSSENPYNEQIKERFLESIAEHNRNYQPEFSLNFRDLEILQDFISYQNKPIYQKIAYKDRKKVKLDDLLSDFQITKKENHSQQLITTVIYYLNNTYLSEEIAIWAQIIKAITENVICEKKWLIKQLTPQENSSNEGLIFINILTVLLGNIKNTLVFEEDLVQYYKKRLFQRLILAHYSERGVLPTQKGLEILRELTLKIENEQERNFQLSKLSDYYSIGNRPNWTPLSIDERDKKNLIIKNFVADLNILLPIGIKKIESHHNYYNDEEDKMLTISYKGESIVVTRGTTATSVNMLLERENIPYRLVLIPIAFVTKVNSYLLREETRTISGLSFLSLEEYLYFKNNHLPEFLDEFFLDEMVKSRYTERFNAVQYPEISYNEDVSAIPFAEYKKRVQEALAETIVVNKFLADINWEWFITKYIDKLGSNKNWYEIMETIIECPKRSLPTLEWLTKLKAKIKIIGYEQYYKELQVLLSASFKEDIWYFDVYRDALRGFIWSCTYLETTDISLAIVREIAELAWAKVPGVGAKSMSVGNIALHSLMKSGKESAFGMLNIMRNKAKYYRFIVAIDKNIDKFKENSTIPQELLADKSIPTFGFVEHKKVMKIDVYKLNINFKNQKLDKYWILPNGTRSIKIPTEITTNFATQLKEVNEEVKQINKIFIDLKKRIPKYWLYDRQWLATEWQSYIQAQPFISPHIENLIWTNKTQKTDFIIKNSELCTSENTIHLLNPNDEIKLWHPMESSEMNINKWQNYIWKNKIIQKERQALREHYPFSEKELAATQTDRFAHHFLDIGKLRAIANSIGWIFTYAHDGGNWVKIYLKPLNITAHFICDYEQHDNVLATKHLCFTENDTTKIEIENKLIKIAINNISLVVLSEVCRQIDLFIATTSVSNSPEFSSNRQEIDGYRTDYEKGMFSDNATAKIRKKIIEKIIPVLGINSNGFEGNYLLVTGTLNTYKINLGSGFAQIKTTQKHLNILPSISQIKKNKKIRLPIEDDDTLYIILAKALFLQDDAHITDESILKILK